MMTFPRFTASFALAGLLVPFGFRAIGYFIGRMANLRVDLIAEKIMLLLWPTAIITLPASPDPDFEIKLFLISLLVNVVIYAVVGMLIWLGLRKHVGFFALAGLPLIAVWWWLLSL